MKKVRDVNPLFYDSEKIAFISQQIMSDQIKLYDSDNDSAPPRIGTLREKTMHKILKYYVEPDNSFHEVKVKNYIADIKKGNDIIEIQTQNYRSAIPKYREYLSEESQTLTVVYPLAAVRNLGWIEKDTGRTSKLTRSPKYNEIYEFYNEIYWIKDFINNERFRLKIILLEVTEIKYRDGWGKHKKNNATKIDRIPVSVIGEVDFNKKEDYIKFIPPALVEQGDFLSSELAKCSSKKGLAISSFLNTAREIGLITRIGKKGNAFIYKII